MPSIDLLPPEFFLADKRKELAKRYFENLPDHLKAKLNDEFETAFSPGGDAISFLRGPGIIIWERYVSELGKSQIGRDFSPLDVDERENFKTTIEESFEHAKTQDEERKVSISGRRLFASVVLLLFGFLIICVTYYAIPKLGSAVFRQSQEDIKNSVGPQLERIEKTFGKKDNVNRELLRLSDSLNMLTRFQSDLGTTKNLLDRLQLLTNTSDTASKRLAANVGLIEGAEKKVATEVENFKKAITPAAPPADSATEKPEPLLDLLTRISASLNQTIVPEEFEEVINQWNVARQELLKSETPLSEKLRVWKGHSWDSNSWTYYSVEQRTAIEDVVGATNENAEPAKKFDESNNKLLKQLRELTKVKFRLSKQDKESLSELASQVKLLQDATSDLRVVVAPLSKSTTELQSALTKYSDDPVTKKIKTESETVFESIANASDVIAEAKTGYEDIVEATSTISDAAKSLDEISELQANLAYRGTAPAVIMLFAIGGMFVTFGLSSLLKWLKLTERAEKLGEERANLLLRSQIGSLLITHGIDPSSFLDRIQGKSSPADDLGSTNPQFPISVTLAEIAKMFNGKH